jgi:hypothetical protein
MEFVYFYGCPQKCIAGISEVVRKEVVVNFMT